MKVIFATTNKAKISRISKLIDREITLLSLDDLDSVPEPDETFDNPLDISSQKALYYFNKLKPPQGVCVLTQDDTLIFKNVDEADSPGVSIKGPVVKKYGEFTDSNAVEFYSELAIKYDGSIDLRFEYGHSLVFSHRGTDGRHKTTILSSSSYLEGIMVPETKNLEDFPGYFLAAMMKVKINGIEKFYSELTKEELVGTDADLKKSISDLFHRQNLIIS